MEVYKEEGNKSYRKRDYYNAVNFCTEGIKVKCKDDELNAKLYSNRATANFYQGKWFSSQFLLLKILLEYKTKTTILFIFNFSHYHNTRSKSQLGGTPRVSLNLYSGFELKLQLS